MRIVVIIQARLGSTRLPGKVLQDLAGEPMLARVVNRVCRARLPDEVVVATTTNSADDELEQLCQQRGWPCFRGSEDDVLDRTYRAALGHQADVVVRITSDCPLIEPEIIDRAVRAFLDGQPGVDYASTSLPERTFPRGLDTEVMRFDALARAWREDQDPAWREHVTPYLYRHPDTFNLLGVSNDEDLSHLRWTVDTPEDLALVRKLYDHFGHDQFSWRDALTVLEEHPEWVEVNALVQQKVVPDARSDWGPLLIRADAGPSIGTGHVMRCLALAQAWQERGGPVAFVYARLPDALRERLRGEGMKLHQAAVQAGSAQDARETAALAGEMGALHVAVDGYHFDADYQRALVDKGLHVLFVDDNGHAGHYTADVVLNQNAHASPDLYASREPGTSLLLGPAYALLRREYWAWQTWQREMPDLAVHVLVTLGGSDPDNATQTVIEALGHVDLPGLQATVLVGGGNPHGAALRDAADKAPVPVTVIHNAANVPELMASADLAVSAGGSTCWELAYMGLPNLMIVLADNQQPIAQELDALGVAVNLGRHVGLAPERIAEALTALARSGKQRADMTRRGRELVDGKGSVRVAAALKAAELTLRPVTEDDKMLVWRWSNDPEVRARSFSSESIPWEDHLRWFEAQRGNPHSYFYIAMDARRTPVGQVRFEVDGSGAVISVSVDASYRKHGYGTRIIELGSHRVISEANVTSIRAYVKPGNPASLRAFGRAGYQEEGQTTVGGHPAYVLALKSDEAV